MKSGSLEVGADRIYYQTRGSGPTLLFVNGGSMDLRQWEDQVTAFEGDYEVVRFDHRGWGRSSSITEPFVAAGDLAFLVETLELEDVVVVGCSYGGGVALDFALEHPERVRGLVLLAPAVGGYPWSAEFVARAQRMSAARSTNGESGHVAVLLEDPHFIPGAAADPALAARAETLLRANYDLYSNDFSLFLQSEPTAYERLAEVRAPTLLLLPEYDVPDLFDLIALLDERIPDSTRVDLPAAGHMAQMERPAEVNAAIRAFLDGLPPSASS